MKGFSLTESIIAIFILSLTITSVLTVFLLGVQIVRSSEMATIAVHLAEGEMEEISAANYEDIVSEAETQLSSPFDRFAREVQVSCFDPNETLSPDCPNTGIKQVKVIVSWTSSLKMLSKSVELTGLISEN